MAKRKHNVNPCFSELFELQSRKNSIEGELSVKGERVYNDERKKKEQIIAEKKEALLSTVSVAEKEFENVINNLCALGVHLCYTEQIQTEKGVITVCVCGYCGKIISATEYILISSSHHYGNQYKSVEIPESEYSKLPIKEDKRRSEYVFNVLNAYLKNKAKNEEERIRRLFFMDDYLFDYYEQIDFESDQINPLLVSLTKAIETKEQAYKALSAFNEEKETQQLMEELCKTFGHDVVPSAYEGKHVTCKCCGITQSYGDFAKEWEQAPLHDSVFKRPIVKPAPEVRTEIRYRGPDYKSPDDYYYYDD